MTDPQTAFHIGDRVTVTGAGRTATWGQPVGTVIRVGRKSIEVHWDRTSFGDQMQPGELRKLGQEEAKGA